MDPSFATLVEHLHPAFEQLMARAPVTGGAMPDFGGREGNTVRGVYLFTEGDQPLYVGRTNTMLARYKKHWAANKTEREAAFAFRLAREASGFEKATYKKGEGSRKWLAEHPPFAEVFSAAKSRIRAMDYRWVEEVDPVCQCLLEVYVAGALKTPYNDFDNH